MDKDTVLLEAEEKMEKALVSLDREFGRLRTGRASTSLVDPIKVDYYGTPTPISQLASVAVPDSRNNHHSALGPRRIRRSGKGHSEVRPRPHSDQ